MRDFLASPEWNPDVEAVTDASGLEMELPDETEDQRRSIRTNKSKD